MDLPGPPAHASAPTRAPASGLKLMLIVVAVFGLLAIYGQWERHRRPQTQTATILSKAELSPSPSPQDN
jgi:hypothetical protein